MGQDKVKVSLKLEGKKNILGHLQVSYKAPYLEFKGPRPNLNISKAGLISPLSF